jgi:hypothetical protein
MSLVSRDEIHLQAQSSCHILPLGCEEARLKHQNLITRGKGVDQCCFLGAGSGGGVDHHGPRGLKYLLQSLEHLLGELCEFRSTVVYGWFSHRPEDPIRHIGRSRNLKKMSSARFISRVCR